MTGTREEKTRIDKLRFIYYTLPQDQFFGLIVTDRQKQHGFATKNVVGHYN